MEDDFEPSTTSSHHFVWQIQKIQLCARRPASMSTDAESQYRANYRWSAAQIHGTADGILPRSTLIADFMRLPKRQAIHTSNTCIESIPLPLGWLVVIWCMKVIPRGWYSFSEALKYGVTSKKYMLQAELTLADVRKVSFQATYLLIESDMVLGSHYNRSCGTSGAWGGACFV